MIVACKIYFSVVTQASEIHISEESSLFFSRESIFYFCRIESEVQSDGSHCAHEHETGHGTLYDYLLLSSSSVFR